MPVSAALPPARIRVLPDEVKSRIAAGEVIERPASVVKELVENALDAGAKSIHVTLEAGGRTMIRVADDGQGMTRTDLELSVQRHATSKLRSADDLHVLATHGFRGEALPSIGSVSRLTLVSRARPFVRRAEPDEAWKLEVAGGAQRPAVPAAADFGTTLEVRDLFYNLPARLKFLKSPGAEAAACADAVLRLALLRPDVAFTLLQGRQEILNCPAWPGTAGSGPLPLEAFLHRAAAALGANATRALVPLHAAGPVAPEPEAATGPYRQYRLLGLVTPPAHTRSDRSHIYLAVNGRAVKDRTLTTALLEAFRHLLPPRRFPAAVLFLECPGPDVDVNVHPAKAEVRFRVPGLVFSLFHHAVREAFATAAHPEPPAPERERTDAAAAQLLPFAAAETTASGAPTPAPAFDLWQGTRPGPALAAEAPAPFGRLAPSVQPLSATEERAQPVSQPLLPPRTALSHPAPAVPPVRSQPQAAAPFRIVGQAAGMYVLAEDETGLKIFDQHALHERILFEELLARARSGSAASQGLLIPETLELSPAQAAAFGSGEARAVLEELGFTAEPFGPRAIAVSAVPACLKSAQAPGFVREILEALAAVTDERASGRKLPSRETLREKAAYVCSCKGAIKAGERLTPEQMSALLHEYHVHVGMRGYTCPHGRPLAVELTWDELERRVGRT